MVARVLPAALIEEFGEPGSPIPGSRFFRAYCIYCDAPIRSANRRGGGACDPCPGGQRVREAVNEAQRRLEGPRSTMWRVDRRSRRDEDESSRRYSHEACVEA